jgi:hypothetical protein
MNPLAQFIGKKLAVAKAPETLQWLVKLAEARMTTTYKELSKRTGVHWRTQLPHVLGSIGFSLQKLSPDIPPIQLLVVNKKTKIPGTSGLGFIITDKQVLEHLSLQDRRILWEVAREKVFYWNWRDVLRQFGLTPLSIGVLPSHEIEAQIQAAFSHGGGEQEDHRRLKEYVAAHPDAIGLKYKGTGQKERTILSGDRLDVLFELPEQWVCVEVKGKQSPEWDILRGIFQCVKYKAVLEAQRQYPQNGNKLPQVRVVLVLGSELPKDFDALVELLAVEVKADVTVPEMFIASA